MLYISGQSRCTAQHIWHVYSRSCHPHLGDALLPTSFASLGNSNWEYYHFCSIITWYTTNIQRTFLQLLQNCFTQQNISLFFTPYHVVIFICSITPTSNYLNVSLSIVVKSQNFQFWIFASISDILRKYTKTRYNIQHFGHMAYPMRQHIIHVITVFPWMRIPMLIISTMDVPWLSFDTQRSFETHYSEGKRSWLSTPSRPGGHLRAGAKTGKYGTCDLCTM